MKAIVSKEDNKVRYAEVYSETAEKFIEAVSKFRIYKEEEF